MYNIERREDGMLMLGASVSDKHEALFWLSYYMNTYEGHYHIVDNAPRFTIDLSAMLESMDVLGNA